MDSQEESLHQIFLLTEKKKIEKFYKHDNLFMIFVKFKHDYNSINQQVYHFSFLF